MKVFKVCYGIRLHRTKKKSASQVDNFTSINVMVGDDADAEFAIKRAKTIALKRDPMWGDQPYTILVEKVEQLVGNVE